MILDDRFHENACAEGFRDREAEAEGVIHIVCLEATRRADLDTLFTIVYCTADGLLPEPRENARRPTTDAEIVTLCVPQAIMGIPSDHRFLKAAQGRLSHLFPQLPRQAGYFKRRRRLAPVLEWLLLVLAQQGPGFYDDLLLIDSTPIECARSRETILRSALSDLCDYGYCPPHSRYFWRGVPARPLG